MKRRDRWVVTVAMAASMSVFGQSPGTSSNSSIASQEGDQKVTVQGCLRSATGMSGSSTGIATLGSPGSPTDGSTAGSTPSSAPGPANLPSPVFMLRVSGDASGASQTGMPNATAGQTDARVAAGEQGGTVYRLVADASTTLGAHVGHQVEVTGRLTAPGTGDSATPQALANASVLTVRHFEMVAPSCR